MHINTEIIHNRMFYQCRNCLHLSGGIEIYSITTVPKPNRCQTNHVRQIVTEVLEDTQEFFQDLIISIDKELAINPENEFIEILEDIRDIARQSLPQIKIDLRKFSGNNRRL